MILHGRFRDVQALGDLNRRSALDDLLEDVDLARREVVVLGRRTDPGARLERFEEDAVMGAAVAAGERHHPQDDRRAE